MNTTLKILLFLASTWFCVKLITIDSNTAQKTLLKCYKIEYEGTIDSIFSSKGSLNYKVKASGKYPTIVVERNYEAFQESQKGDLIIKIKNSNKSMLVRADSIYKYRTMQFNEIERDRLFKVVDSGINEWEDGETNKWLRK